MNGRIFASLAKNELIKHGKGNKSNIFNLPFVKIIDIIDSITQETSETKIVGKPSIHTHCATFGLGGGRDECWNIDCRLSAAEDMARFAALYSDKVYIHNFLADFSPTWGHPPEEDNADFKLASLYELEDHVNSYDIRYQRDTFSLEKVKEVVKSSINANPMEQDI